MLGAALTVGVSPIEVKEIVYEAVCDTFVRLRAV
jgi:hypothetical protein